MRSYYTDGYRPVERVDDTISIYSIVFQPLYLWDLENRTNVQRYRDNQQQTGKCPD